MDTGYVHSVETFGTVDGPGIRYVLFLQGCRLRCKFCHNRDAWEKTSEKKATVADILSDISNYADFYRRSGGGVTASGGEPALQPDFVVALFEAVKDMGLNTALDTSGHVEPETVNRLLDVTDLVLFGLKALHREEHKALTGVSNERVLDFAAHLKRVGKPVWLRYVLLPGVNDDEAHLEALAEFARDLGNLKRVEILGYHKLGTHKWALCDESDPLPNVPPAEPGQVEKVRQRLRFLGLSEVH